jgi:hypothetical protein
LAGLEPEFLDQIRGDVSIPTAKLEGYRVSQKTEAFGHDINDPSLNFTRFDLTVCFNIFLVILAFFPPLAVVSVVPVTIPTPRAAAPVRIVGSISAAGSISSICAIPAAGAIASAPPAGTTSRFS